MKPTYIHKSAPNISTLESEKLPTPSQKKIDNNIEFFPDKTLKSDLIDNGSNNSNTSVICSKKRSSSVDSKDYSFHNSENTKTIAYIQVKKETYRSERNFIQSSKSKDENPSSISVDTIKGNNKSETTSLEKLLNNLTQPKSLLRHNSLDINLTQSKYLIRYESLTNNYYEEKTIELKDINSTQSKHLLRYESLKNNYSEKKIDNVNTPKSSPDLSTTQFIDFAKAVSLIDNHHGYHIFTNQIKNLSKNITNILPDINITTKLKTFEKLENNFQNFLNLNGIADQDIKEFGVEQIPGVDINLAHIISLIYKDFVNDISFSYQDYFTNFMENTLNEYNKTRPSRDISFKGPPNLKSEKRLAEKFLATFKKNEVDAIIIFEQALSDINFITNESEELDDNHLKKVNESLSEKNIDSLAIDNNSKKEIKNKLEELRINYLTKDNNYKENIENKLLEIKQILLSNIVKKLLSTDDIIRGMIVTPLEQQFQFLEFLLNKIHNNNEIPSVAIKDRITKQTSMAFGDLKLGMEIKLEKDLDTIIIGELLIYSKGMLFAKDLKVIHGLYERFRNKPLKNINEPELKDLLSVLNHYTLTTTAQFECAANHLFSSTEDYTKILDDAKIIIDTYKKPIPQPDDKKEREKYANKIIEDFSAIFKMFGEGILYEYNNEQLQRIYEFISTNLDENNESDNEFLKILNIFIFDDKIEGLLKSIQDFNEYICKKLEKNNNRNKYLTDISDTNNLKTMMGAKVEVKDESIIKQPYPNYKFTSNP